MTCTWFLAKIPLMIFQIYPISVIILLIVLNTTKNRGIASTNTKYLTNLNITVLLGTVLRNTASSSTITVNRNGMKFLHPEPR